MRTKYLFFVPFLTKKHSKGKLPFSRSGRVSRNTGMIIVFVLTRTICNDEKNDNKFGNTVPDAYYIQHL